QYDIRHAVAEGGESWPVALRVIAPHIDTIAVKDFRWSEGSNGRWEPRSVPLGEGLVDFPEYLRQLHVLVGALPPVTMDFEREPLIRPTGFKGGYLTELWQPVARLDSDAGHSHIGIGTQSVLWCDPAVLAKHSESAGNALMLSVTDRALQMVVGETFTT